MVIERKSLGFSHVTSSVIALPVYGMVACLGGKAVPLSYPPKRAKPQVVEQFSLDRLSQPLCWLE